MKQFTLRLRQILLCRYVYYVILFLSLSYLLIYTYTFKFQSNYDINRSNFIAKIIKYNIDGDKLSLIVETKELLICSYYFDTLEEKISFISNYEIGDSIEINGSLNIPKNNTIPNTFNYKKYLYYQNIQYILSIDDYKLISKNKNIFYKIKNFVYKKINSIEDNEYLYAFILGNSKYIDNGAFINYRINGITHLFALSGLHVSIFSSILLFILKKINLNEKLSFILVSLFLILFSFIASFSPSILRATIFFILCNLNKIYYTYVNPVYLLYITFSLMIFYNPFYIFNLGFILSFMVTFFLLLISNIKIKSKVLSLLFSSIISFLAGIPIIINNFYEINIIGFINNIFFIPLVSNIIFPLSILTLIFNKLSVILKIFTNIMEYISFISSKFININLYFTKMGIISVIIYYLLLILTIKLRKKIFIFALLLLIIICYIKPYFNNETILYFIDVGQGDSALIKTKNNKYIMIDTGGKIDYYKDSWARKNNEFSLMKNSIIPFLKSIGSKQIDYLFLTHGDADHMGDAINLVENFKVEKVIFNCGEFNELEQELIKVLEKKKIPYYSCIKELNIDNDKLYFLNNKDYGNENDNSSVIYTKLNNHKFLFMGDAGVEVEKNLIEKYNLQDIDVLKVGHHGSKTSSSKTFIDEINPKYSIISVGENNRYGHPNGNVLANLADSKIYRTDQDGSIMFKTKNNKLEIKTCVP